MDQREFARYEVDGDVAVITLDNPPLNALAPGMREGLMAGVERAAADTSIRAIVVMGAGAHFVAGADVRQFGKVRPVSTRTSAATLESCAKPIVAAIDGYALGGGLEHALACHYRLATPRARLGVPEIKLGLIPGGGGTQRLPRLVGPVQALDLILSGRQLPAAQALQLGLVDAVVEADGYDALRTQAVAYARQVAVVRPLPRTGERSDRIAQAASDAAFVSTLRQSAPAKSLKLLAGRHALACVEAALTLGLEEGIALEQRLFNELENSDESRALRYAFSAERDAAKLPGAPADAKPEPVRSVAVIGAGTMGSGIAIAFADAGIAVRVLESSAEALERGLQRIRDTYATRVKRGSLSQPAMDDCVGRIHGVMQYEDIGDCDAVIEAVFERVDIKQEVFARLDRVMKPGALLLTNSSAIDIDVMAAATQRPGDVAGAHFFAPANVMKLCEVVRGPRTSMATLMRTMKMGRDIGKTCAVAGSCDGFVANRSRTPMMTELMLMLEEGARPDQVDRVMVAFGYPMGPFAVNDISGLDVSYEGRKRRAAANPDYRKLHVPDRLVEMGRKGQKTGAGWYRYERGDRTPHVDPAIEDIIGTVARELGITQRSFSDEEILQRQLFASVNEACRILEEGKAYRGSDIDAMWLHGFGFPRHRGGLMFWADSVGAATIHQQVRQWHEAYGPRWKPSALLAQVAAEGGLLRELRGLTEPA